MATMIETHRCARPNFHVKGRKIPVRLGESGYVVTLIDLKPTRYGTFEHVFILPDGNTLRYYGQKLDIPHGQLHVIWSKDIDLKRGVVYKIDNFAPYRPRKKGPPWKRRRNNNRRRQYVWRKEG